MRKVILLLITAALIVSLISCKNNNTAMEDDSLNTYNYSDIKPEEAKELLETRDDVILLDVRTPGEYAQSHIPNSILIPLDALQKKAQEELNKDSLILVYCRSGNRSRTASRILSVMGYQNIRNLGGIIDWPYETEAGE